MHTSRAGLSSSMHVPASAIANLDHAVVYLNVTPEVPRGRRGSQPAPRPPVGSCSRQRSHHGAGDPAAAGRSTTVPRGCSVHRRRRDATAQCRRQRLERLASPSGTGSDCPSVPGSTPHEPDMTHIYRSQLDSRPRTATPGISTSIYGRAMPRGWVRCVCQSGGSSPATAVTVTVRAPPGAW